MSVSRFNGRNLKRSVSRSRSREKVQAIPKFESDYKKSHKKRIREKDSDSESKRKILENVGKITEINDNNKIIIKNDKSNIRKHSDDKTPPSKNFIIYFIRNF